jgi:uncharacterized membrane protein
MVKSMDALAQISPHAQVAHVEPSRPLLWLGLAWDDIRHNPGPSIGHGVILAALGWLILLFCSTHIDLFAAAVSGFLLVGPVFGAGLYELSRLRAAGQAATFDASLDGAMRNGRSLASLGALLAILAIAWVWLSGALFVHAFGGALPSVYDGSYRTIFEWHYAGFFVTYLTTGAFLAAVAFILSAVSAPLIFDRGVDTRTAISTSIRVVRANPVAMALWAALIAALTVIGFVTFLVGLVIVLPLLGHATWHAYRDLVV